MQNNTAGVREREDASRTREAGDLDEIQAKPRVACFIILSFSFSLVIQRSGVGSTAWLDAFMASPSALEQSGLQPPRSATDRCVATKCLSNKAAPLPAAPLPSFVALSDGSVSIEAHLHVVKMIGDKILWRFTGVGDHLSLVVNPPLRIYAKEVIGQNARERLRVARNNRLGPLTFTVDDVLFGRILVPARPTLTEQHANKAGNKCATKHLTRMERTWRAVT